MLTILLGAAGSGKTKRIGEDLREKMASRRGMVLLTPEQQSHRAERRLAALCGPAFNLHGEVLSFTRMASRVFAETGGLAEAMPDRSGRLLLMALGLDAVGEKLRRGGGRRRLDDLRQLTYTSEELRSAMISPEQLLRASELAQGTLRDKLWDLGLVLEAYEAVTERLLGDRRDAVARLAERVGESSVGLGGVWVDGFTDFTAAELRVLEAILRRGSDLTVALTLPEGEEAAFAVTEGSLRSLLDLARRRETEVKLLRLPDPPRDPIRYLASQLYRYEAPAYRSGKKQVELCRMDSFAGECRWAASRIRELMASDPSLRCSDFALAAPAFRSRRGTMEAVLREYELPFFVEEAEELGKSGLAVYILSALAAISSWRGSEMIRCLRTGFGGLSPEETDELENYCLTWDLRGEGTWRREEAWDLSPGGYGQKRDSDGETLLRLNALRERVAAPFGRLADALEEPGTVHRSLEALSAFLEETGVRETLRLRWEALRAAGETAAAAACLRLWGAMGDCLGQLDAVLGEVVLQTEELRRLLELLFESREVGAIPAALDAVSLGSPARLRGMKPRVLLVLGADDDSLPELGAEAGIFSSEEKRTLSDLGIRLGAGQEEELTRPLLELYSLAASPRDRLLLSWSGGEDSRPSLLIQRAAALLGAAVETEEKLLGRHLAAAPKPALSLALGEGPWAEAVRASLGPETVEDLRLRSAQSRAPLRPETAGKLYGRELRLTPSRAETFYQCAYLYFLQYGLKAKERKTAEFAAPESGTFIHYVLENVCRAVRDEGGFASFPEEELPRLTARVTEQFARENFKPRQLRDKRFLYLFRRLCQTAETIVLDVAGELAAGDFQPLDFELSFSDKDGDLPPLRLEDVTVQGTADRVDGWVDGDKLYLCVADYKTGKKKFSLTDVRYGLGIQMLVYLFLLSAEGGEHYGKEIVPAGVLYAPAREVLLDLPRSTDAGEIEKKRADTLRRSGLLLCDKRVLQAREHGEAPRYLPVKYRDGVPAGSVATAAQLGDLASYVRRLLGQMGKALRRGENEASPLYKNKTTGPCLWCPYGGVCGFDPRREKPRMELSMPEPEFWETLRKEARHG
ncbi:MAG: PD-(D/E)XK nuclease family protein [Oscillospiraceae bacterium]|nr:PD-(D/E)XK nuclease family protein [Oscillospiraceae bacterium]